jgi:predicted MFS family arabinose efflux permease
MKSQQKKPFSEPWFLFILAAIQFTHILDFMIIMPQGPVFMNDFKIDAHQFGWLVSSYTFGAALMAVLGTTFLDQFSAKKQMMLFYLLFVVATFVCALSPFFGFLVGVRFLAGCFGGLLFPLSQTLIAEFIPNERRGRAMGVVMGSFSVASVLGVPLGLWVVHYSSWRMSFLLVSVVSLLVCFFAFKYLPESKMFSREKISVASAFKSIWSNLTDGCYIRAYAINIFLMMSAFSVIPFITIFFTKNLQVSFDYIPLIYLFGGACTLVSSRVFGWMTDRFGQLKTFRWVTLCSIVPIFLLTHLQPLYALPIYLVVSSIFFVFVSGTRIPMNALMTTIPEPSHRASFMSMNTTMQHLGMSMASLLSGYLLTQTATGELVHYDLVGSIAVCFAVISIVATYFLRTKKSA